MHFFDEGIACRYGVNAAILFQFIKFWCEKNAANAHNYHDGYYWTYNTEKAYSELFPYLTKSQVRTALKKLVDDGAVITGNYNSKPFDRTLWYAVTEKGLRISNEFVKTQKSILEKSQMQIGEIKNPFGGNPTPIPDINTDEDSDIKPVKKTGRGPLKSRGEFSHVLLSDEEVERLEEEYGEVVAQNAINYLDRYIEEKGYKSKNHNLTIRRWVVKAINEKKGQTKDIDWDAL